MHHTETAPALRIDLWCSVAYAEATPAIAGAAIHVDGDVAPAHYLFTALIYMKPIPVLFIDASTAFRHLAGRVLERHFAADITLVAEGNTWPLDTLPATRPLAVLLGLGATYLADLQLLATIQNALPDIPVVVLGHLDEPAYQAAALAAGAAAFVSKDALGSELIPALQRIIGSPPRRPQEGRP